MLKPKFINFYSQIKIDNILNDEKGFKIGKRKITVSTAGLIPGIEKLARREPQVGLAISLAAPNNKLRNKIMPVNKKYPLEKIIKAVDNYIEATGRRVTFEYVLIQDVNDSLKLADQLADLFIVSQAEVLLG